MIACDNAFPTRIIFGKGARREIGTRLKEYSGNVLFIYGGGSIKRTEDTKITGGRRDAVRDRHFLTVQR